MAKDNVFISYSHLDKKWLNEVKKSLGLLVHSDKIILWDDNKIGPGSNWHQEIMQSIGRSKVAILLISRNFLASEFVIKNELPRILKAASKNGLVIFNLILDTCAFKLTELKAYQSVNDPERPLDNLKNVEKDKEMLKLTESIHAIIQKKDLPNPEQIIKLQEDEESPFLMPLIVSCLMEKGPMSITGIQDSTKIRRKLIVDNLESLKKIGYLQQTQGIYNKKPSALWKVSAHGASIFNQFKTAFTS